MPWLSIIISSLVLLALFGTLVVIVWSFFNAPYAPSVKNRLDAMLDLANIQPGDKAVDLGSGDGRVVIAMAQAGAEAHGYEINPWLVLWSRYAIRRAGLKDARSSTAKACGTPTYMTLTLSHSIFSTALCPAWKKSSVKNCRRTHGLFQMPSNSLLGNLSNARITCTSTNQRGTNNR